MPWKPLKTHIDTHSGILPMVDVGRRQLAAYRLKNEFGNQTLEDQT